MGVGLAFAPAILASMLLLIEMEMGWPKGVMKWAFVIAPLWLYGVSVASQLEQWSRFAWLLSIPTAFTLWCLNIGVCGLMWMLAALLHDLMT